MEQVEEAIAEIEAALLDIEPKLEGLKDYARLNLLPATLEEVNLLIVQYERRKGFLTAALAALQALVAEPEFAVREISPAALEDLQNNANTINIALGLFESNEAASISFTAGAKEPK